MNAMDRPIDPTFLRRQRGKRIAYAVVGVAALLWLSVWLPSWIRPALDPDRIRTAQVQWGAVEETITASGTVVPQFEQIIFSPINTRLVRILQKPGAMLQQGQPIVELDLNAARLDVEKRAEELALKAESPHPTRIGRTQKAERPGHALEAEKLGISAF